MVVKPKLMMRRRDVESWLESVGIPRNIVQRAIAKGLLPKIRPFAGNSKAFYLRDDVVRVFGLRDYL